MSQLIESFLQAILKKGNNKGIQRGLAVSFGLALSSLILLTSFVFYFGYKLKSTEASIVETHSILNNLQRLKYELINRESLQREFLATGDSSFLLSREKTDAILDLLLQTEQFIGSSRNDTKELFVQLKLQVQAKLSFGDEVVSLAKLKGLAAARERTRTGVGLRLGNAIPAQLEKIEVEENTRLREEREEREKNRKSILFLSFLGAFGTLGVLGFSYSRLRKQIKQLSLAEQQSKAASHALQNIVDTVKDPLLILGGDLRIVGAGKSFYDTFKVLPEGTVGRFVYEFGQREWDIPQFRKLLGEVLSKVGEGADFEVTNRVPNLGQKTWLVSAKRMGSEKIVLPKILVSLKDITSRKEAENSLQQANAELQEIKNKLEEKVLARTKELRTHEELLKQAVSVAKLGIFNENLITKELYLSEEFRQIYNWDLVKNYTFDQWTQMIHPEDVDEVIRDIELGYEPHGTGMIALDHRIVLTDGSIRWMSTKAKTFFEGEGLMKRPVRVLGATIDITERKKYEEIITSTLESLIQEKTKLAESNRSLERFASVAAHDLRAPIRSVGLWVEMMEQSIPKPCSGDVSRAVEFLKLNSSKSSELIDDLLEIAKIAPKNSKPHLVDLKRLTQQLLLPFESVNEARRIITSVSDLPNIFGSLTQWESVLGNLIRNALMYQNKNKIPEVRIWSEEDEEYYYVFVQDNGVGIAPQYQSKIFEMFERLHTDIEFPGTGIGLALCKKIVEGWGGKISLESEQGKGSTFRVSYPKAVTTKERKSA